MAQLMTGEDKRWKAPSRLQGWQSGEPLTRAHPVFTVQGRDTSRGCLASYSYVSLYSLRGDLIEQCQAHPSIPFILNVSIVLLTSENPHPYAVDQPTPLPDQKRPQRAQPEALSPEEPSASAQNEQFGMQKTQR